MPMHTAASTSLPVHRRQPRRQGEPQEYIRQHWMAGREGRQAGLHTLLARGVDAWARARCASTVWLGSTSYRLPSPTWRGGAFNRLADGEGRGLAVRAVGPEGLDAVVPAT